MAKEKLRADEVVANMMIDKIEKGELPPWQRTWRGALMPQSINGHAYRGMNLFTTLMSQYDSPFFLTQKMVREAGGRIKPEHYRKNYFPILFFNKAKDKKTGDELDYGFWKFYQVYNLEQCEDIKLPKKIQKAIDEASGEDAQNNPIAEAITIISGYKSPPTVEETRDARPAYSPSRDVIFMPNMNRFHSSEEYYSTKFHEMGHSTGHHTRLNRDEITSFVGRMGDHAYSKEELVAEFTSAMLCGRCGISKEEVTTNSAAYLKHWVSKLREKPKMLVEAASKAQKAVDHIVGKTFDSEPPPSS